MLVDWWLFFPSGPEHQELQVPEVANVAELQQPASSAPHGNPPAEQPDGAVVADAFPHAVGVRLPQRFQGVVLQSPHWNGGGLTGVQRGHCQETAQGVYVRTYVPTYLRTYSEFSLIDHKSFSRRGGLATTYTLVLVWYIGTY